MYSKDAASKSRFTPKITVIGVGGAGGNAVNNMIASKLEGVNFLALNTDAQALENSLSTQIIQLGTVSTGGLGAGARPEIGRAAAEESLEEVMSHLNDQNMVFITAGMGGGTGTGAAPVIARACKEKGILTVGVVTKPFQFEGAQRMRLADSGIDEMAQYVDTLIVIPNQNLFRIANEKTTFAEAFRMADNVLQSGVRGVTDLMVVPGMINLDFADVRSATSEMGKAMMGTGEATGDRRAIEAAEQAINNPLLDDVSMKGARSVIINISGGHDLTLFEIEEACNRINDEVDPDATIIFGSTYDDNLEGKMRITVVATGIEAEMNRRAAAKPIRPVNYNVQPKRAEEIQPLTDSFVTRYPEPARHGYTHTATSMNVAAPTVYAQQTQVAQNYDMPEVQSNQAVGSYQDSYQQVEHQPIQEVGMTFETDYVTEGSSVRKVEVQLEETHATNYHNSVIPPYAPAKQDQVKMESSLVLNPPIRPTVQKDVKKVPSLFERITGRHREVETVEENNTQIQLDTNPQSGFSPVSTQMERKTVMTSYDAPVVQKGEQGMLNIETPAVQPRATNNAMTNEDLDIPAFLRRQIS